jgi:alkanesulfonate monooxygenase SsuD/methylene tetrahydromethanopterin reductase-like flavin-dependent oxidoreductase (luciferase family)
VRFAFKTFQHSTTWTDLIETWRAGDELEIFESGWIFDHYYRVASGPDGQPRTDPTSPCFETWTTLAALAACTRRLRLGVIVTGVVNHNIGVLAKMAATVDHISAGRLELSLGAGSMEDEKASYGMELGSPKERLDRLEEAIPVVLSLFTQELTNFDGTYVHMHDARLVPKPVQQPYPPITIGGTGANRTLRLAARWASHWNTVGYDADDYARKCQALDQRCLEIGRDPKEITRSAQLIIPAGPDGLAVVERAPALFAAGADVVILALDPPYSPGRLERVAQLASALAA